MSVGRLRAVYGGDMNKIVLIQGRALAMHDGINGDPGTYLNPPVSMPAFLTLIQNLGTSQQQVKTRVIGATENREVHRGLLLTAMDLERTFVQALSDANPSRAGALITNAGLVIAGTGVHTKPLLTVRNGKQSGILTCDANVGLLVGTGAKHPNENRYFNWSYTLDGSKTFISAPSTTRGKTVISGLTPLTMVGVRVSLTNSEGPGEWSQVVTKLVL